ncbi:MAG: winged helix-turn-helix transcriptional regulator [Ktedonobacteraceae bacterium]|nr:winged helix-turn-helix transcriptional regulator [Ktedonobacteraceae bacterium]
MARSRSIPTKLFWDPDVSDLDSDTQIVLIAMTLEADDWGRGRAHVGFLARACNKAPAVIERALQQLENAGLIRCYQVGRHRYYVQCRWQEWETLSNPTPSNFPAPPSDEDLPQIPLGNSGEFGGILGNLGKSWETPPEGEGEEKRTEEEEEGEAEDESEGVSPDEPPASPTSSSAAISRCENTRTAGETVQQGRYAPRGSLPLQGDPVPGLSPGVPGGYGPPPAAALCRDGPPDRGADRAAGDQAHPAPGDILSAQRQETARSPGAGISGMVCRVRASLRRARDLTIPAVVLSTLTCDASLHASKGGPSW